MKLSARVGAQSREDLLSMGGLTGRLESSERTVGEKDFRAAVVSSEEVRAEG